ncbi:uncharacterized protein METZ01_LOCUS62433, partial [marine metagenome]
NRFKSLKRSRTIYAGMVNTGGVLKFKPPVTDFSGTTS